MARRSFAGKIHVQNILFGHAASRFLQTAVRYVCHLSMKFLMKGVLQNGQCESKEDFDDAVVCAIMFGIIESLRTHQIAWARCACPIVCFL